jgi:hypothetical protein
MERDLPIYASYVNANRRQLGLMHTLQWLQLSKSAFPMDGRFLYDKCYFKLPKRFWLIYLVDLT